MSWIKEFNCRQSIAFVTDGSDETYVLGADNAGTENTIYPITRNGVTFGWVVGGVDPDIQQRDRNSGVDRRLAGINFITTGLSRTFRVDLPAPGDYRVRLALGDMYGARATCRAEILDTSTSRLLIDHASGFTSGANFRDATNTEYSAAAWPGSNTAVTLTFATTICNLLMGGTSRDSWWAHLSLEQVEAGEPEAMPTGAGVGI